MGRLQRIINNPRKYLSINHIINNVIGGRLFILWMKISPLIKSDKFYIRVFYRLGMGKKLNIENPVTFTEKLQWLKLHNINPLYSRMVDKFRAREIVSGIIGEKYLVPLLGVWDKFEDINFKALPDEFVLKTTHDSGTVLICRDKTVFDFSYARQVLNKALKKNYFYKSREYPYKNAIPRIIAEKLLKPQNQYGLNDYKFFCFNGKPEFLLVVTNEGNMKFNSWFDINFNPLPFNTGFPAPSNPPQKPENFTEMITIAEELSVNLLHIRIDLYNIDGKIYFGEFTFHHAGGLIKLDPPIWDKKLGELLSLTLI